MAVGEQKMILNIFYRRSIVVPTARFQPPLEGLRPADASLNERIEGRAGRWQSTCTKERRAMTTVPIIQTALRLRTSTARSVA
jgi:hypothetical protein